MSTLYEAFVEYLEGRGFVFETVRENESAPSNNGYAELAMGPFEKKPFTHSDTDQIDGVFRIILRYPEGSGISGAAEDIEAFYSIGSVIEFNTNEKAVISGFSREAGAVEAGWYKLILNVHYQAKVKRRR